ncbi:MAG TPA: twin-arginine translocase TatA/TatE family subunit [Candidatus Paceibacterota bacterium]|nr:twin-arginine translocase TatA/TatE family subunit [Candidatus Paceibacterota bacterium]HPT17943.1 twin-arginine translocase TatA/TatE family subunit [Candidatus Paceibacterota bacterium]
MFGLGIKELIIIAVIVILLFGSKKIPEFSVKLVNSIRKIFKKSNKKVTHDNTYSNNTKENTTTEEQK